GSGAGGLADEAGELWNTGAAGRAAAQALLQRGPVGAGAHLGLDRRFADLAADADHRVTCDLGQRGEGGQARALPGIAGQRGAQQGFAPATDVAPQQAVDMAAAGDAAPGHALELAAAG